MKVTFTQERELILDILGALGAPAEKAETQARWLLEADLRGQASHGLQRLPLIAERIQRGLTVPAAEPVLDWVSQSSVVVDGGRGLGPCVGLSVMEELIQRAPEQGAAVGAIANANHLGLLAPYVERCAEEGLIGIAITTSEALVHPWNGRRAMVGTNPIAVAVPASPEPFVLDMATGAISMGKILAHRNSGVALEPGWALDADGEPTTDPAAAAEGSIAPFGGAKGYGLGLAFELLVGAVTGTALGTDVTGTLDARTVCNKGDLFICLDPVTFGSPGFAGRVTDYLHALREAPAQEGASRVLVPGDRARSARARHLSDGIPIAESVWSDLQELRQRLQQGSAG